ncbi:unnamed protein product, partial [Prorocentrum cordatum]
RRPSFRVGRGAVAASAHPGRPGDRVRAAPGVPEAPGRGPERPARGGPDHLGR